MGTITERFVHGLPTPAESNCFPAAKPKRFALGIENLKIPLQPNQPVVEHRYFSICHLFSLLRLRLACGLRGRGKYRFLRILHFIAERDGALSTELLVVLILHGHANPLGRVLKL